MNERIKELLKQASKLANTDDNKDFDRNFDMIVAEKFAELIVRECIQAVKNVGGYNEEYHMNAIKKYFGVEE
jgi:hypothetical protein